MPGPIAGMFLPTLGEAHQTNRSGQAEWLIGPSVVFRMCLAPLVTARMANRYQIGVGSSAFEVATSRIDLHILVGKCA